LQPSNPPPFLPTAQLVDDYKIEGDYAKPDLQDLFLLRVLKSPYLLYLFAVKYHRRYISTAPLPKEEMEEMAMEAVGLSTWEKLAPKDRDVAIEAKVWFSTNRDAWRKEMVSKDPRHKKLLEAEGDDDVHVD